MNSTGHIMKTSFSRAVSVGGFDKQDQIIKLCGRIKGGSMSPEQIATEIAGLSVSQQLFSTSGLKQYQLYAWVCVYRIVSGDNKYPSDLIILKNFIKQHFKNINAQQFDSNDCKKHFQEITKGGQLNTLKDHYDFTKLEKAAQTSFSTDSSGSFNWLLKTSSKTTLYNNLQTSLIDFIKNEKLSKSCSMDVFMYVFVEQAKNNDEFIENVRTAIIEHMSGEAYSFGDQVHTTKCFHMVFATPTGLFKNSGHPFAVRMKSLLVKYIIEKGNLEFCKKALNDSNDELPYSKEMQDIAVQLITSGEINPESCYKLFQHMFYTPEKILNNKAAHFAIVNAIGNGKFTAADNYKIFDSFFINIPQNSIFAANEKIFAPIMHDAITKAIANGHFTPEDNYKIFKYLFIDASDDNIFAEANNPVVEKMREAIIQALANGNFTPEDNYKIFKYLFINIPANSIFAEANNPVVKKMHEAIIQALETGKFTSADNYKIFEYLFINIPAKCIFTEANNQIVEKMRETITHALAKGNFTPADNYKIFEYLFINPPANSVFTEAGNPITLKLSEAIIHPIENSQDILNIRHVHEHLFINIPKNGILSNEDNPITQKLRSIITDKLKIASPFHVGFFTLGYSLDKGNKFFDSMVLNLYIENRIQDPEVIETLAIRLGRGEIDITAINKGIDFFVKLIVDNHAPLLNLLIDNLDYFIQKDGCEKVTSVLLNNLMLVPVDQSQLEEKLEIDLIQQLQSIKTDISVRVFKDSIFSELTSNTFSDKIDSFVKEQINNSGREYNQEVFGNLNQEQLTSILNTLKTADNKGALKLPLIKNGLKNMFMNQNQPLSEELVIDAVNIFADSLSKIKLEDIKKQYINDNYCSILGMKDNDQAIALLNKYSHWNKLISDQKNQDIRTIKEQILTKDYQLKAKDPELYYSYVISTLPYRSYQDIYTILNNDKEIPPLIRQQLELVSTYCNLIDLENDDTNHLAVLVVQDKHTNEYILISLQDIGYLNPGNISEFTLQQFKINRVDNSSYLYLQQLCKTDSNQVNFGKEDSAQNNLLLQRLQKMQVADNLNFIDEQLLKLNTLSLANLNTILGDEKLVTNLHEIISEEISLQNFQSILVPDYLKYIVGNKFTAGNIVAQGIIPYIKGIVQREEFKVTAIQLQKLEEITYQSALALGHDITIPLDFKKTLMESFNDNVFASVDGDFIKLKTKIEQTLKVTYTGQIPNVTPESLAKLAQTIIDGSKVLAFAAGSDKLLEDVFNSVNQLPALNGKIARHELCYLFGVLFIHMSSIKVLGYHDSTDNKAFSRFRLMGGYWLSRSVVIAGKAFSAATQAAIAQEIKAAVLTIECSGLIANKLYLYHEHNASLKGIAEKIKDILEAKLV